MSDSEFEEMDSRSEHEDSESYIKEERSDEDLNSEDIEERDYSEEDYEETRSIPKKKVKKNPNYSEEENEPTKRRSNIKQSQVISPDIQKPIDIKNLNAENMLNIMNNYKDLKAEIEKKNEQIKIEKRSFDLSFMDKNVILKGLEKELDQLEDENNHLNENNKKLKEEVRALKTKNEMDQKQLSDARKNLFQAQSDISSLNSKIVQLDLSLSNLQSEIKALKSENSQHLVLEKILKDKVNDLENEIQLNQGLSQKKDDLLINAGYINFRGKHDIEIEKLNSSVVFGKASLNEENIYEIIKRSIANIKKLESELLDIKNLEYDKKFGISEITCLKLKSDVESLSQNISIMVNKSSALEIQNNDLQSKIRELSITKVISDENEKTINLLKSQLHEKNLIINELKTLNQAYELEFKDINESRLKKIISSELDNNEDKSLIIQRYNTLKTDWAELRKEYLLVKEILEKSKKIDKGLKIDQINDEYLISNALKEIDELKRKVKNYEEELKKGSELAREKISKLKAITRDLLGWEIREKDDIIELENALIEDKNKVILKRTENIYNILDAKDKQACFVDEYKELLDIFNNSYPIFFSFVNVNLKPELKPLLKI